MNEIDFDLLCFKHAPRLLCIFVCVSRSLVCLVCVQQMRQLQLLNVARTAKAQPRTVVLTRATRDEVLRFSVLGGIERGCGLYITKVDKGSKADVVGLKRGDQVSGALTVLRYVDNTLGLFNIQKVW